MLSRALLTGVIARMKTMTKMRRMKLQVYASLGSPQKKHLKMLERKRHSHPLENNSQRKLKHFSSSPARAFPSSAPLTLATVCFRAPHQKAADEPMQPSIAAAPARAFPSSAPLTLATVCFRAPYQKAADEPMQPSVAASTAQASPSSAPLTLATVSFRAPHQKAADEPMQPSVAAADDCVSNFCCCSAVCKVFVKKERTNGNTKSKE